MLYKAIKDKYNLYTILYDNGKTYRIVRLCENSLAFNIWKSELQEKFIHIDLSYEEKLQAISYITRNYDTRLKWLLQALMERPWNGKERPFYPVESEEVKKLLKTIYI